MNDSRKVKALGEIALRTANIDALFEFYRDVVGLEPMVKWEEVAFFKIAEGYGGHAQVLALFAMSRESNAGRPRWEQVDVRNTTLHHLAFTIDLADYESEKRRLEGLGLDVRVSDHAWVQWRSLYINDPDGNVVEFVCFDGSIEVE